MPKQKPPLIGTASKTGPKRKSRAQTQRKSSSARLSSPKPKEKEFHVRILNNQRTIITKERSERWDTEDSIIENSVYGFSVEEDRGHFSSDVEPEPGKTYYLVAVTHTEGDTFRHVDGEMTYVFFTDNFKDAEHIARTIKLNIDDPWSSDKKKKKVPPPGIRKVNLPSGKSFSYSDWPWRGYFERFQEVSVINIQRCYSSK